MVVGFTTTCAIRKLAISLGSGVKAYACGSDLKEM
jgi:hypothetical protein